jgi:hypothetical protein
MQNSFSQDCSVTSVGFTPINDLGSGYFRGFQGGLYPGGSNARPFFHNILGKNIAANIVPLDTAGIYDPVNGKIVLMSVGMSNTNYEFTDFMTYVSSSSSVNPKLVVVNGAQGGKDISKIINPLDSFWIVLVQKLALQGVTPKQVQAVWYKEAEASPHDTNFVTYTNSLKVKYKTVMNILKSKYPNVKLCYNTSRIFAGYATTSLNPEPYAYYNGWTVKWMIEDQLYGDTTLRFDGPSPNSPWLSWGPYVWADGNIPRSDGLSWICPTDFVSDGTHPSAAGRIKVASRLFNFFSTDETTKPWFLKNLTLNLTFLMQGLLNIPVNTMFKSDTLSVYIRNSFSPYNIVDASVSVIDSVSLKGIFKFYSFQNGRYYLQVKHRNSIETWSRAAGENLIFGYFYNYDFTTNANKAYGNNLILVGSKYCAFSGDINQDGTIDASDVSNADNDSYNSLSGYVNSDVTGDDYVDAQDVSIVDNNAYNSVNVISP